MTSPVYLTVAAQAAIEVKIEKSIFIGQACEAPSVEAARAFISQVRETHREATHNCYAYRIGESPQEIVYFNDHGEPAGTAGKPILGAILKRELTDAVVVVTRYFGGKKLGVRGLIEAYGHAAGAALDAAGVRSGLRVEHLSLSCSYPQHQQVVRLVRDAGGSATCDFGAQVLMRIILPAGEADRLRALLAASGLPAPSLPDEPKE